MKDKTASPLLLPLGEAAENGERPVRAETGPEAFPDALSEGALVGPVVVEGRLRAIDETADFQGTARGRWRFECTRCLAPIETEWRADVEATAPLGGGPMDLTEEVRQAIALAQPMKLVCRPDCRGLCPVCRADRNLGECGHAEEGPSAASRPRLTPRHD